MSDKNVLLSSIILKDIFKNTLAWTNKQSIKKKIKLCRNTKTNNDDNNYDGDISDGNNRDDDEFDIMGESGNDNNNDWDTNDNCSNNGGDSNNKDSKIEVDDGSNSSSVSDSGRDSSVDDGERNVDCVYVYLYMYFSILLLLYVNIFCNFFPIAAFLQRQYSHQILDFTNTRLWFSTINEKLVRYC